MCFIDNLLWETSLGLNTRRASCNARRPHQGSCSRHSPFTSWFVQTCIVFFEMHWRLFTYQVTPHLLCLSSFYCFLFLRHKTKTDHFRSAASLSLKAMLSAKPLIWSWFLLLMQVKLIFTKKFCTLPRFEKQFLEVGNREQECDVTLPW